MACDIYPWILERQSPRSKHLKLSQCDDHESLETLRGHSKYHATHFFNFSVPEMHVPDLYTSFCVQFP